MNNESNPIDLAKLKLLIHNGLSAIPIDKQNNQAVLVIGDTGVGKSTIMSFLSGDKLQIKREGLTLKLDNPGSNKIKIGHEKFSETTIPTKVSIEGMAFYDCPGFKDNKGEQFQISNSFFVQRLLDSYKNVKLVLIIDESHISEARADKLPKLVKNLHASFKSFQDIKDGVCLIINRAAPDHTIDDYNKEMRKMTKLKNQNGPLFNQKEQNFLDFLMFKQRILLFRQPSKTATNFQAGDCQHSIIRCIKQLQFVKSKHIQNILSQSAKLSIRDFIDEITQRSNTKIQIICAQIIEIYTQRVQSLGRDVNAIVQLKSEIIKLAEEIMSSKKENIVDILQREMPPNKIQDFEEDFASIMFFKGIYDKTQVYFSNLTNKIYSELSHLITKLDKRITVIQREVQQEKEKQVQLEEIKKKQEIREKEKIEALEHCSKMDELKLIAQNICANKKNLIEEIKTALRTLGSVEEELRKVKVDAVNLKKLSKEIDTEFERIDVTYFQKRMK